ncbi:MAG: dihydrodipicolinate synthase family protein, partial [Halomonadaceae bacterium]|nr:dihydrodipicolinate synthase family protein [Halomonadaceae bacterium]
NTQEALRLSESLNPLWALFSQHGGSLRVVATAAELKGLATSPCLPLPLKGLEREGRQALAKQLDELQLT